MIDPADPAALAALDGLLGLDVEEAVARAREAGWLVRTYQPGDLLTADYRPQRVNLRHEHGRVTDVRVG